MKLKYSKRYALRCSDGYVCEKKDSKDIYIDEDIKKAKYLITFDDIVDHPENFVDLLEKHSPFHVVEHIYFHNKD